MVKFLVIIGGSTLLALGILTIHVICCCVFELITRAKRNYQIKHRFDKPPTAQCYCRDCRLHNNETSECHKFSGWRTADSWFCWDADPRQ